MKKIHLTFQTFAAVIFFAFANFGFAQEFLTITPLPVDLDLGTSYTSCASPGTKAFSFNVSGVGILNTTTNYLYEINFRLDATGGCSLTTMSCYLKSPAGTCVQIASTLGTTTNYTVPPVNRLDYTFRNAQCCLNKFPDYSSFPSTVPSASNINGRYGVFSAVGDIITNFNGQNADGTWILYFAEGYSNVPAMAAASIKFGNLTCTDHTADGDNCINAIVWNGEPFCGSTVGKNPSGNMPKWNGSGFASGCDWNNANNNDVWIKFTPSSTDVCISISSINTSNELQSIVVTDPNIDGDNDPCTGTNGTYWTVVSCPRTNDNIYAAVTGTARNHNHCFTATPGVTYYLVVDGNAGAQSTFYITGVSGFNPCQPPTITASPSSICSGDSSVLTAIGASSYSWSAGLGTGNPVTVYPTMPTTYTVTGTSPGCTATASVSVSILASANATITPAGPFCTNDAPYSLSAADPGGVWSGTGINPSTGVFSPSVAGPGSFNITYTISGSCGDADTVVLTVNQAQNATINPAGPFCPADSPVNLTAVNGGGVWSGTGITNGTLGTFDPSIAGVGTHIITYQISGSCGDTDTIILTVANSYNATINPAGPFCSNSSPFTLTAANAGGTWSGTGVNPTTGLFTPSVSGVGTFNIIYTISGSCGDDDTIAITVNQMQNATINPAGPFCVNSSPVNLTAASSGGVWSGTGITNSSLGTFNPSAAGAGTYTITYGIAGACGDTATTSIVVNQLANATITPAGPFCTDDVPYTLIAANTGGTWSGTGVNPSTGVFSPSVAGAGTFNIIYTISGACGDDDTISVQVNPAANATINPAGPFCIADTAATLTAAQSGGTWSGTGITNTTNGTFNPSLAGVGSQQIIYIIAGPCGDADTINVSVITQADATINPAGPFCANIPATNLTAITSGGSWSGTGITNITNGTFDPSTAGQGNHLITYTIAGSCGDEDTAIIKVVAAPMLAVNGIAVSCEGATDGSAGATAGGGTPPYTFHWDNNATTQNITDLAPGSYLVVVTDANGCQEARTVTVDGSTEPCEIITPVLYVPNTFTPNGDGNNDILYVRGQGVKSLEFVIYDRWGEKIFESEYTDLGGGRVSLGWDGTFHGKPMVNGAYIWRLQAEMNDDKSYKWKGSVTLIR